MVYISSNGIDGNMAKGDREIVKRKAVIDCRKLEHFSERTSLAFWTFSIKMTANLVRFVFINWARHKIKLIFIN